MKNKEIIIKRTCIIKFNLINKFDALSHLIALKGGQIEGLFFRELVGEGFLVYLSPL